MFPRIDGSRVRSGSGSGVRRPGERRAQWRGAVPALLTTVVVGALAACGAREPDVPAALRDRLRQDARLADDELARVRQEIGRRVGNRAVRLTEGGTSRTLDPEERRGVLEVLTLEAGVFDEGVRREDAATFRVLNGPARSTNAEIEAAQRLWVDVETLLPRRYEFAYAFPGVGEDRTYELTIEP